MTEYRDLYAKVNVDDISKLRLQENENHVDEFPRLMEWKKSRN